MQLSAYEIAIIGGGFTVIGTALGAWITYRFALALSRENIKIIAGVKLRAAFAPAMAKRLPFHSDLSTIDRMLRDELTSQAIAIEEFRHYVPRKDHTAYQKAWENYYKLQVADCSVFLLEHTNEELLKHLKQRIHEILQFTE